ncbi:MAG TPA: NADH-quinone oxidoreductase subunit C [Usitatibacter sp.]|nr:NADH-quinone oxidoreductase subunit C [Usitatibacter sp.]
MKTPAAARVTPLPGAAAAAHARVDRAQWVEMARGVHEASHRLVALWGADHHERDGTLAVLAAYALADGLCVVELAVPADRPTYPDLSGLFPAADRMQRALRDLLGVAAEDADARPWLRHGAWRADEFPLRRGAAPAPGPGTPDDYPFVRVEGDGVHEIPVGPIHAGIIEPGHFRFSVVGEKVLRLEERLGYTHKGIGRRFRDFTLAEGYRLAGRVSGDSTVAYAWAYAQAAESILGVAAPPRAHWLRALMLERERVANHLGDLGALGNDAAFAFSLSQFMRLKEDWLRLSDAVFGHRFMMDRIVPGGVAVDPARAELAAMAAQAHAVAGEAARLRGIFDEHSGLQDRFITAGRVTPDLARRLGLVGLAGRASGQPFDLRVDHPCEPYRALAVKKVVYAAGDVAARVHGRFDELFESLRLIEAIVDAAPPGEARVALPAAAKPGALGVGWIEGWRGEVLVALEAGAGGRIADGHAHDPSWHAWPLIEHAVIGNIVPDFPLINKSFNLSYSGVDG